MARPVDAPNSRLLSKVSTLYYEQEFTQQQIANRLELSRPKVSRLLKQAKDSGIVQITVSHPEGDHVGMESKLEQLFSLNEAIVVDSVGGNGESSDTLLKTLLGGAAANHLSRSLSDGDIIGVTWGTTLQAMVEKVTPTDSKDLHIVQMLGGFGPPEAKAHTMDISRSLSRILNAGLTLLQSPGVVDSPEIREVLLTDRRVKNALSLFSKVNKAYVGIGAISTNRVLKKENNEVSHDIQQEIIHSDAVGDIGLNFFNRNGETVNSGFSDRFIGMTLEQLKQVKTVVGIAGGTEKYDAIRGALAGGYINVLITDRHTALLLIEEAK
ncbi:sugar-binding transcriptional regulator [Rhodohalobacter sp. SW132]|uniref:sugar-binding transcriptional regulator n=1 Tax=Rhodohalobacter sp. SW132 TaxID=2293433 RepID=UPI000E22263B|nr:sugar-binding transcriptional regulator [Rhodohalobacter sp. SW132]REL24623.1 sugar-binding transcriptional regulator [Rhodohalobacter sp. SW132]